MQISSVGDLVQAGLVISMTEWPLIAKIVWKRGSYSERLTWCGGNSLYLSRHNFDSDLE